MCNGMIELELGRNFEKAGSMGATLILIILLMISEPKRERAMGCCPRSIMYST